MNNFLKILKIELKTQLTPSKLAIAITLAFVPLISPIATHADEFGTISQTWPTLGRIFTEATMYTFILRLISITFDKQMIDKNRAQYVVFNKYKVLFAKITIDFLLFIMAITFSVVGGSLIVYLKGGKLSNTYAKNVSVFIIGVSFFYMFIAFITRWFLALNKSLLKRSLMIVALIFSTIILYVVLFVTIGVVRVKDDSMPYGYDFPVRFFFIDNIKWISFIPFLNFGVLATVLYGFTDYYYIFPLIVEIIIIIAIFTKSLAKNFKQYLCT